MDIHGLQEIILLLGIAVAIVTAFKALKMSSVLGYLVAGMIAAPYLHDTHSLHFVGELGVVFLLFYIGLELSFERFRTIRWPIYVYSLLQIFGTGFVVFIICHLLGLSWQAGLVISGGLALSSTAVILHILTERHEMATQTGRVSLAVLIMQDIMVVLLLVLVPLLGKEGSIGTVLAETGFTAVLVLFCIVLGGKLLLQPLFKLIASLGSYEVFTATTLLIVLGAAFLTHEAGLSLALGALAAGLMVGETEYRLQVENDVKPFKGLLMGLFFMTVGMSINLSVLWSELGLILLCTLGLLGIKAGILMLLGKIYKFETPTIFLTAAYLCQGSEFAFALFLLADQNQIIAHDIVQILYIAVALSMAVTPMIVTLTHRLVDGLAQRRTRMRTETLEHETQDMGKHVILIGFGRVGHNIADILVKEELNNFVILDNNSKAVSKGRKEGYPVFFGHVDRPEVLRSIGIERASMVVVTLGDKKLCTQAVRTIHRLFPDVPVIARAQDRYHAKSLYSAGAKLSVAEAFESSMLLGAAVLKESHVAEHDITRVLTSYRTDEYPSSLSENGGGS